MYEKKEKQKQKKERKEGPLGQSLSGTEDKCLDRAEGGLYSDADFTFPSSWEASVSPEGGRHD